MKKWLKIAIWTIFIGGVITLMYYTQKADSEKIMDDPKVDIVIPESDAFLNKKEIITRLDHAHLFKPGQKVSELEIEKIEEFIQDITQVKTTRVYKQIGGDWRIDIELRKPIARIFPKNGHSYYLSDDGYRMSTTPVHTAHIVVVTGEIDDNQKSIPVPEIINNDSLRSIRKLDDIYRISNYVCNDPLFRSLIGQIHLEKNGDFLLVPLVGDQKIVFGSAYSEEEVSDKFKKLKIFYEEAMPFEGWDKYSEISLKYEDQIVCKTAAEVAE